MIKNNKKTEVGHASYRKPAHRKPVHSKPVRPARGEFLPVNRKDMKARGWDELDFLVITGDAYVDHPSFGAAIISRCLEAEGYKVGIIAQPDWRSTDDFNKMGRPRLGVMVAAGNLDSMLNHYTASGKKRRTDEYSPGGKAGLRPDRATMVYCNRVRELWKDIPLIIGGIEASLRRIAHYDYWSDNIRRSILVDAKADILIFGMAESSVKKIAEGLSVGKPVEALRSIPGICWRTHNPDDAKDAVMLPSFAEICESKELFTKAFAMYYHEQNAFTGKRLIQDQGAWYVVQNKPSKPLSQKQMDEIYAYPYTRTWHIDYDKDGGIPAFKEVSLSITSHRGCFGECSFCALVSHQGRVIQSRSHESIIDEAKRITHMPEFKGYIHDVGGPTANFRIPACKAQLKRGACQDKSCLFPKVCPALEADHSDYMKLLRELRSLPGIKKVFIRSGLRYDYILADKKNNFIEELCKYHVSGQLKIAPEHASPDVLKQMRKPSREVTKEFVDLYRRINEKLGMKQFLVPYLMSSHPGSTLKSALELAEFIRDTGLRPEQVQDFTPTPGSVSTCMYYTGINPLTGEKVYVPKTTEERKLQRALLQYWMPENEELVRAALRKLGREDLIGRGSHCLVPEGRIKHTNRRPGMDKKRHSL